MGYGLWVMGYGLWVMGYGLWVMGYGLWVMGDSRRLLSEESGLFQGLLRALAVTLAAKIVMRGG